MVLFLINSISCSIPDQQPKPTHAPQLVEAKSYSTPKDSLKPPIVRPEAAYNPEYIKAGEPTVIPANTNITVAKSPRIIGTGNPVICIPGKGGFKLPEVIIAKDSPYAAGVPTTTVAMNPSSKDNNPMNFSTYGKLQGLLHQSVSCIYPDKEGNLWIGYGGDGVTKFDGTNFTSWEIEQGFRNNSSHILEDRQGNIWFADNIVTRYDGKNFTVFGAR